LDALAVDAPLSFGLEASPLHADSPRASNAHTDQRVDFIGG
jgi:hypothetical protein